MPGIVLLCDTGLFHAFNRQRGKEAPQKPKSITGAGTKTPHPSQSEGSIPVAPPLSRLLCFLSCRSKKGRPRWQALVESRLKNRLKGYKRVTMTTSKYQPRSKPQPHRPLAPSVTANAVPAPSRRELWGANLSTLACCYGEVPAVESLSQKSKIFASSHRPGALRPVAADNAHGGFLRIVASLTRPVSLPSKMGNENIGTVHALTAAAGRHYSPKNPPLCRRITT